MAILNVCRSFYALSRATGPEVLTRATFCRMACAFGGFSSMGRPWLARAATRPLGFQALSLRLLISIAWRVPSRPPDMRNRMLRMATLEL